jgi:hypothetical protein
MTQALYAHMNNETIKIKKKKEKLDGHGCVDSYPGSLFCSPLVFMSVLCQ